MRILMDIYHMIERECLTLRVFACIFFFPLSLLFSPYIVYYVSRYTGSFVCRSVGFAHFFDFRFVHSFLIHDIFFTLVRRVYARVDVTAHVHVLNSFFYSAECKPVGVCIVHAAMMAGARVCFALYLSYLVFYSFFFAFFFRRSFACCMGAACYCCGQRYQMFGSVCMGNSCGMHHVMMVLHTYIYIQYTCFIARFV